MTEHIYIDYTKGIFGNEEVKFHGGASFTNWLSAEILDKIGEQRSISILVNKGFSSVGDLPSLFKRPNVEVVEIQRIIDFEFRENSILIIPLIPSRKFKLFKQLKCNNLDLKLHVVVHGVRNIDLVKYDAFDKYYLSGVFSLFPLLYLFYKKVKCIVEKYNIRRYLQYADKVFTVSNNSLQHLVRLTSLKFVKSFHQQSNLIVEHIENVFDDNFILFVSAGRVEKNFVRALMAFLEFKKADDSNMFFYATGINEDFLEELSKSKGIDRSLVKQWVKCVGYVSQQELSDLYRQSKFLLYTSLSEGYGIPLIEACEARIPVVASYNSSIPEVLGASAYYVDPKSIKSIVGGIRYMSHPKHLELYDQLILNKWLVMKKQQEIDCDIIIHDFIN